MKRRALLRRTGALGALLLAGCTGDDSDGGPGSTPSPDGTPSGDTPADGTPTPATPTVTDASIRTVNTGCLSGDDDETARISVDRDARTITVSGLVQTGDPCHEAVLEAVHYEDATDTLQVNVSTTPTGDVCVQCVGKVEYEATITLAGGVPSTVTVSHHGEAVTSAGDRESSPTPTEPAVADSSISTLGTDCLSGDATASISTDADASEVRITGTLETPNPCYEATLRGVEYVPESDALVVDVGAEATKDGCPNCVGGVEYEATVAVADGLPGTITVAHGGDVIATSGGGESTPTPGETPALVDSTLSVTDVTSASQPEAANVTFQTDAGTVVVRGTIRGKNGCATATLGAVEYDAGTDTLAVDVVTTDREGTGNKSCTQALVYIDYEARMQFEGGLPEVVTVSHDGDELTSASRGSASAGDGS